MTIYISVSSRNDTLRPCVICIHVHLNNGLHKLRVKCISTTKHLGHHWNNVVLAINRTTEKEIYNPHQHLLIRDNDSTNGW